MTISEQYRKLRGDYLYHYTHEDNVESIVKSRYVLFSQSYLTQHQVNPTYITDDTSRGIDKHLGYNDYVFLVFSTSHPFIYRQTINKVPIKHIKVDVSILDMPGVQIADRVSTDSSVTLYTPEQALNTLKIKHCNDARISDKELWNEVKKYEILIPDKIDLNQFFYRK